MSLFESALFLDRVAMPSADAVVAKVAAQGHRIAFPARFSLTDDTRSGWINVTLDGQKSGFDYAILPRQTFLGDGSKAGAYPEHGDSVLSFVARGSQTSIMAMTLVQRAICELSDARGWWQEGEESFGNEDMIAFCDGTLEAIDSHPAPVAASRPRFDGDALRLAGKSLFLFAAVLGGIYLAAMAMGYFFAPGAPQ